MSTENKGWQIQDWDANFEFGKRRKARIHSWFAMSNRLDSDEYITILDHKNGATHLGAWDSLLRLGSGCSPRGLLVRGNGAPHDIQSISLATRIPVSIFEEAIPRFLEIGLLEEIDLNTAKKLAGRPNGSTSAPKPLTKRLVLVLERLGMDREQQVELCDEILKDASKHGGPDKFAEGLEKAFKTGKCHSYSAGVAFLRRESWHDGDEGAENAREHPEVDDLIN